MLKESHLLSFIRFYCYSSNNCDSQHLDSVLSLFTIVVMVLWQFIFAEFCPSGIYLHFHHWCLSEVHIISNHDYKNIMSEQKYMCFHCHFIARYRGRISLMLTIYFTIISSTCLSVVCLLLLLCF